MLQDAEAVATSDVDVTVQAEEAADTAPDQQESITVAVENAGCHC